ncbi:MAG: glycosyltransferase family 1 protein, partial [Pseudomonadota bacterium]
MKNNDLSLIFHPFYYDWEKYPIRGVDRYNFELLRNLRKLNFDPLVLDSGFIKNHVEGVVKELIFPLKLLSKRCRVYHATHPMGAKWALMMNKKPLITTIHDLLPFHFQGKYNDWGIKYKVKTFSIKIAAQKSDHLVVGFNSSKDFLINNCGVNPERISIINYGIDHETYFPDKKKKATDEKIIFFVGELSLAKGVDTLIKAAHILIQKDSKLRLILGSNGKDREMLVQLTKDLNISGRVEFVGRIREEDLPQFYRSADISVFPSRYGFGLASLEAFACGTPAIAGKTFDALDFIDDERILVDPEDAEELAHKMSKILYDDSLRNELISEGIVMAKRYSWERMTKEMIDLYNRF